MKILIIGGTGIIGGSIAEAAVNAGHDVYIISKTGPKSKLKDMNAHFLMADWFRDDLAEAAVTLGFDVIVDALIFNEKHIERSARIINGHCTHFIYISTDSVYPHPGNGITEDTEINEDGIHWEYGKGKFRAEQYLRSHSSEYGFYWTVIRPTITFGETRIPVGFASQRNTCNLADRIREHRPVLRFDDPSSHHAMCHSSVFGNAVTGLMLNSRAAGQIYHISDDRAYTYGEVFESIEKVLGIKGKYVYLPPEVIRRFTSVYEDTVYDKNPEFTLSNAAIKSACSDVNYSCDMDQVMAETVRYLESQKEKAPQDCEYDLLTDLILFENAGNTDDEVKSYVNGFSKDYIIKLKRFDRDCRSQKRKQKIKDMLTPAYRAVKGVCSGKKK
ncbi:MAG: NAD-dependent epimerase/dehydratase family protein [Clostridiales bacterium]|nr:NAD-dependent epimerase/dehydratase family protein [Clostridiales bacterium]